LLLLPMVHRVEYSRAGTTVTHPWYGRSDT
jgi:hypothetical protein